MLSDLYAIEAVFDKAACPEDVFGEATRVKHEYRRIAQVVHPDHYESDPTHAKEIAQRLLGELTRWYEDATAKIAAGTYGDGKPHVRPAPAPSFEVQLVETPKRRYTITSPLASGDIADLYLCGFTDKSGLAADDAVFKIARHAGDNDLLENESKALSALYPQDKTEAGYYRHLPRLHDSFLLRGKGGARRVNVIQRLEGYRSVADVMRGFPSGLDFRDAVWMFKRALGGLGFIHRAGRVHGAVLPTHLMIHPTEHHGKLIDWSYSVPVGTPIKAISKAYRADYPPEVLSKGPATPATDIYMLGRMIGSLIGMSMGAGWSAPPAVPPPIAAFLKTCCFSLPSRRPQDAWELMEDLDKLLLRLVGLRTYRPLVIPTT